MGMNPMNETNGPTWELPGVPPWLGASRKALGIVRVSSRKQSDNNSPEIQREGIEAYAKALQLELTSVVVIEESAKDSGTRFKFHEALQGARKARIRHLIFWVWDRIARNYTDVERLEEQVREDLFVLHLANDRRVLFAGSTDSEWLTADINTLTSKHYARELRRRAIESMAAKAQEGWYPAHVPLGYRNVRLTTPDGDLKKRGGTVEIIPEGKKLVRRMVELRVKGFSLLRIAEQVVQEGIVPPRHMRRFQAKNAGSRVELVLKDPFYKGEFEWRGKTYRGKHEPMLTPQEWDTLQETFGKKATYTKRRHNGALAGWLNCADCGCRITYDPKKKPSGASFDYYRCANGKHAHERLVYAREEDIFTQFSEALDAIQVNEKMAAQIAEELNASHGQARKMGQQEAAQGGRALADLDRREDDLYGDLKRGLIDEVAYRRQREHLKAEKERLERQLTAAKEDFGRDYLITARMTLELATKAKSLWISRNGHEKRELLEKLLSNPTLSGKTLRYDLKKPFSVLAEMREKNEWRAAWGKIKIDAGL